MAEDRADSQSGQSERGKQGSEHPYTGGASPDGGNALTYEQARDQLAEVVRRLEAGGTTLEDSLALWERGEALATICEQRLHGVRARLAEAGAVETERPGNEA